MIEGRDKLLGAFYEETQELLQVLEKSLLSLEKNPGDTELIDDIFRAMHTIKGSSAMFGFDDINRFTHEMEDLFDFVRNGEIEVTNELIDLTLVSCDLIAKMLRDTDAEDGEVVKKVAELREAIALMLPEDDEEEDEDTMSWGSESQSPMSDTESGVDETAIGPEPGEMALYRIRFKLAEDIFNKGTNPLVLLRELASLGRSRVVADTSAVPGLKKLKPDVCYTSWDMALITDRGIDAVNGVFIFVAEECELKVDVISRSAAEFDEEDLDLIGGMLADAEEITNDVLDSILDEKAHMKAGAAGAVGAAGAAGDKRPDESGKKKRRVDSISSIRVPADKLDKLVDLVGELVTVQARLSQAVASETSPALTMLSEEVERLTEELRDNTMSIRMLPIGTLFVRFSRLVRDLSADLGKECQLMTEGAETELDKNVIEKLNDPLVHLIRNAIDHGIEGPDEREALGKPGAGTVRLSAEHSGHDVLIRISDDGAGLDMDAVRRRAVERGLAQEGAVLSESELCSLVLMPGFTTAEEVTSLSGRGVGLDVVKRVIDSLRGSVTVSSIKGKGTTVTLRIPLTLAIIEGLLVKVGADFFVIPLSSIEECVELSRKGRERDYAKNLTDVRGEIVPYIILRDKFGINGDVPGIEQIVITRQGDVRVGFVVDKVIGEHQTVLKTLGKYYREIEGVSGATILGDGTVALIVDVGKLIEVAEMEQLRV